MPARSFTPTDIEMHTEWTAAGLRALRQRDHIANFGTQTAGGHWKYSKRDLVGLWIAGLLNSNHGDPFASFLPGVFAVSYTNAPTVIELARGRPVAQQWTVYLHRLTPNKHGITGGAVIQLASLADLEANPDPNADLTFHRAEVFNWKHFAETMPDALRALVLED